MCLFAQSCPFLCDPMDCNLPGSSVHGILQARILEWVAQGIFPTQGLNLGLPHCRWILYHLSHQGSSNSLVCCRRWGVCVCVCVYICVCVYVCVCLHVCVFTLLGSVSLPRTHTNKTFMGLRIFLFVEWCCTPTLRTVPGLL